MLHPLLSMVIFGIFSLIYFEAITKQHFSVCERDDECNDFTMMRRIYCRKDASY